MKNSGRSRQEVLGTYRFTHPLALDCLSLLSPVHRVGQDSYRLAVEPGLQPLFDPLLRCRSTVLREMGLIIALLFDAPPVPELYVAARPLIKHILGQYRPVAMKTFHEAIVHLFDLLHETSLLGGEVDGVDSGNEKWAYGYEQSHPLWTMHVLGAKIQRVGRLRRRVEMTCAYRRYAVECHQAFRWVEAHYLEQANFFSPSVLADHIYICALSLRYFLQFGPAVQEGGGNSPSDQYIHLAVKNLATMWGVREEKEWPARVQLHQRNITEALRRTWCRLQGPPSYGDPGGPHERLLNEEPSESLSDVVWMAPTGSRQVWYADRVRGVSVFAPIPASALAHGECPEDYATELLEIPGAWRDRRAAQMAAVRQAQRLHRDMVLFPYVLEDVQLYEYAWLYQSMRARSWEQWSATEQGVIAVLMCLIHLGGDLDALLGTDLRDCGTPVRRLGEDSDMSDGDRGATLLIDPGTLEVGRPIPVDWSGYRGAAAMASDPVSRAVCQQVRLTLPPFLREILEAYLTTRRRLVPHPGLPDHGHLFLRVGDPPVPLTREDILEYLRAAGAPDPAGLLRRIVRSFFPFYVSRLGLDPLQAAYVSGTRPRLVATQLFYGYVDDDRLNNDYGRTARAADELILSALRGSAERIPSLTSHERSARASAGIGYGSRIVPQPDALRRFVVVVREQLARLEGLADDGNCIRHLNLFMAYAYVLFQLLSGARPLRDGRFSAALASPHPHRLRLADKKSGRHVEVRMLRRRANLNALRLEVERACRFARDLPSFQIEVYEAMGGPLLFFLDWDGKPVPAEPGEVRRRLDEVPEVGAAFPWPLNDGRHLLETALRESGADREGKDFGLGHTRRWSEALSRFSVADVPFLEADFAQHADAAAAEFGLEILPFRPGSRS